MIRPHFINSLRNINLHNSENTNEDNKNSPIITASWDATLIAKLFTFTARESEIVRELLRGKKDEEIAKELCIACSTLRTHIRHIYAKTEVHNRTSLCHKVLNKLTGFA